jgi:hypothetical protein
MKAHAFLHQCRTLADEVDDLAKVSFQLPPDALKPAADAERMQSAAMARTQELPSQQGALKTGAHEPTVIGVDDVKYSHALDGSTTHACRTCCFLA